MESKNMRYRRIRGKATPPWSDKDLIQKVYSDANTIRVQAGVSVVVDHIYPLGGDVVSGLHVAENLQILTTRENCRKGRKLPGVCAQELWDSDEVWTPDIPDVNEKIVNGMLRSLQSHDTVQASLRSARINPAT